MATSVTTFTIKRHDLLPSIRLVVTNKSDGTPYDFTFGGTLTPTSVTFLMYDDVPAMKVSAAGSFDGGATTGVLLYDWQGTDTDTEQDYNAEFEVLYPGGKKLTLPNTGTIRVRVLADLNNV